MHTGLLRCSLYIPILLIVLMLIFLVISKRFSGVSPFAMSDMAVNVFSLVIAGSSHAWSLYSLDYDMILQTFYLLIVPVDFLASDSLF